MNNGVIALLFGAGESCQSSFEVDGNVLKTAVGAFFASGGLVLPVAPIDAGTPIVDAGCVCTCPIVDAGTPVIDSGTPDAGTPIVDAGIPAIDAGDPVVDAGVPSGDVAQYNFETSLQGFTSTVPLSLGAPSFGGNKALTATFMAKTGTVQVQVADPIVPRGAIVVFHAYIPAGALTSLQVFVQSLPLGLIGGHP